MPITRKQRKVECPFCKNVFLTGGIASHFKVCEKIPDQITHDERRMMYLSHNYQIDVIKLIKDYSSRSIITRFK